MCIRDRLLDHIDNEIKKFENDLKGPKMELVISEEEFKVKIISW